MEKVDSYLSGFNYSMGFVLRNAFLTLYFTNYFSFVFRADFFNFFLIPKFGACYFSVFHQGRISLMTRGGCSSVG
jgi:hypothetical protein